MSVPMTINLPDSFAHKVQALQSTSQGNIREVVLDTLQGLYPMLENSLELLSPPIAELSDEQIQALAASKMDSVQNQRLGDLQAKGKIAPLNPAEQHELVALFQIYQLGQLRKAEAMAESVRRGIQY
jgi:hypothetical protein